MPVTSSFRFTSGYGYRRDPKRGGSRLHRGIDLAAPRGTPIFATADGVVTSSKFESGYGNTVRIQHGFGFETVYAHQSRIRVKPGQRVSRGDRIGDMGRTGRATGVHLHYEVHLNGRPVNPMTYVEAAKNVF
jgi:murein DD-endopeptidase MepM/ murein hydrolase activator NlpD